MSDAAVSRHAVELPIDEASATPARPLPGAGQALLRVALLFVAMLVAVCLLAALAEAQGAGTSGDAAGSDRCAAPTG